MSRDGETGEHPVASRVSEPQPPRYLARPGRAWTTADLIARSGSDLRYELARGEMLAMTPTNPLHGMYSSRIVHALRQHVAGHDLGEVFTAEAGFELHPEPEATVRAPDVSFIRKERMPIPPPETGFWPIAPDLVVEVISPTDSAQELQLEVDDYLAAGVRIVWLIYPKTRSAMEFRGSQARRLAATDTLDGGEVVPGLSLSIASLFAY